jgi:hypothetical protein
MTFRSLALLAAAAVAGALGVEGPALAATPAPAPVPARLAVVRGPGTLDCPDAATLAALVAGIRGHDSIDTAPSSAAPLALDVSFEREASGYRASIRATGSRTGERALADRSRTCAGLTGAVAATLALFVDEVDVPPPPAPPVPEPPPRPTAASLVPDFDDVPVFPHEAPRVRAPLGPAKDSVYFELLGAGLLYSVNYERFLLDGRLGVRAGTTLVPAFSTPGVLGTFNSPAWISFPVVASYYLGPEHHKLQLGAGATFFASCPWQNGKPTALGNLVWGYRYVPRGSGVDFGVAFTPVFGPTGTALPLGFTPMGGILVGGRF